jgi:hypothetical protein
LRVVEKRTLRRTFGPKREEASLRKGWRNYTPTKLITGKDEDPCSKHEMKSAYSISQNLKMKIIWETKAQMGRKH